MKNKLFSLMLLMLVGCQVMNVAIGRPNGDTKGWKTYSIEVGENVVHFSIPPGESKDFPAFAIPERIDLAQPDLFDEANAGPRLLSRVWDYKKNRLTHVGGVLRAGIVLYRSEKQIIDLNSLKHEIENSSRLETIKLYLEEGSRRPSDRPFRFGRVQLAGEEAWKVRYEISGTSYAVALGQNNYLLVGISYDGFERDDWRADASAAADAVLRSIRIESR